MEGDSSIEVHSFCFLGGWTSEVHQSPEWRQGEDGERAGEKDDSDQRAGSPLSGSVWPLTEGTGEHTRRNDSQERAGLRG